MLYAITLYQPWATLVAEGLKPFEFRSWKPPERLIGQRIAIHAGARMTKHAEVQQLLARLHSTRWRETGLLPDKDRCIELLTSIAVSPGLLPLSSVLCTAILGKAVRNEDLAKRLQLINDSDRHEHSSYGWPLSDVIKLEPFIPANGHQGFWRWNSEELQEQAA